MSLYQEFLEGKLAVIVENGKEELILRDFIYRVLDVGVDTSVAYSGKPHTMRYAGCGRLRFTHDLKYYLEGRGRSLGIKNQVTLEEFMADGYPPEIDEASFQRLLVGQ